MPTWPRPREGGPLQIPGGYSAPLFPAAGTRSRHRFPPFPKAKVRFRTFPGSAAFPLPLFLSPFDICTAARRPGVPESRSPAARSISCWSGGCCWVLNTIRDDSKPVLILLFEAGAHPHLPILPKFAEFWQNCDGADYVAAGRAFASKSLV